MALNPNPHKSSTFKVGSPQMTYCFLTMSSSFKDFLLVARAADRTDMERRAVPPGELLQGQETLVVKRV